MRAIALLSGGLDSVVAAWVARDDHEIAAAITFDYGQRARVREIQAARAIAERIGARHIVIDLPWLGALGSSALTDAEVDVPHLQREQLDDPDVTEDSATSVWVPNRNGVFLNVAAAWAETLDCDALICGFNREEAETFPDNTPQFMAVASEFFALSTRRHPVVISPTVDLAKTEIVDLARRRNAPVGLIWSCYHGGKEHCWNCESCQRLKRALENAGAWEDWDCGRLC